MDGIVVRFGGICTHFPNFDSAGTWRVVLVNASDPDSVKRRSGNDPRFNNMMSHVARLRLVKSQVVAIQGDLASFFAEGDRLVRNLNGAALKIQNAAAGSLVDRTTCGLPRLSDWKIGGVKAGSAASSSVATDIACRFDFKSGTLEGTATIPGKACLVRLTAPTTGNPQLIITPFGGGMPTVVTLRNPDPDTMGNHLALVEVGNSPMMPSSAPEHFLLHYLLADRLADGPGSPNVPQCGCPPGGRYIQFETPACSNSQIP